MVQVIFRHTGFAEKQGGMCWHQILAQPSTYLKWPQMEKCSTWKSFVLSIRTFWSLGHRHLISSQRPKLCSKYWDFVFRILFGTLRPQDCLVWKNDLHGLSSPRRNDWFWYKSCSNPSSYAKFRAIGMQLCQEAENGAPHQTPCLMGSANNSLCCTSDLTLKMNSDQKTFNVKVVRLVETVKCFWAHFHPRSFTTSKVTRKVQPV